MRGIYAPLRPIAVALRGRFFGGKRHCLMDGRSALAALRHCNLSSSFRRLLHAEAVRSGVASDPFNGGSAAMTAIAFGRKPLRILGSLKPEKWALRTSDRRGQDKARKVHAVGRVKDGSDFNRATNIAKHRLHLAMFGNVLSPLNFRHPLRPK